MQRVRLPISGGYGGQSLVKPGETRYANRGLMGFEVNVPAIGRLGRAGVDLNRCGIRLTNVPMSGRVLHMRADDPTASIAEEIGRLAFELRRYSSERGRCDTRRAGWEQSVGGEFGPFSGTDLRLLWEHRGSTGDEGELLFSFDSNAPPVGHLRFSLQELLTASCHALGEPVPKTTADALALGALETEITHAGVDGAIDVAEARRIVAAAEAGGIGPHKVRLVQDLYEQAPVVAWTGRPRTGPNDLQATVLEHPAADLLRSFLGVHYGLGGDLTVEQDLLRRHPLPEPPAHPEYPLLYVCGGSPDFNVPHQSPLRHAQTDEHVWVGGGNQGLTISTPGGTIGFPAPAGGLQPGGVYEGGPRIVSGTRGGGGYVMNEGGRFRVHELSIDPSTGRIRKAVVSWIAITHGGFGADLGLSPGYLVYDRPPLDQRIVENPTYQRLVAALHNRGTYDASPLLEVLGEKGYVDDTDRELLKALRREYGVGLTSRVDVSLLLLIGGEGIQPLTQGGRGPTGLLRTVLHNQKLQQRTETYREDARDAMREGLETLGKAVDAGYKLTIDDRFVLTQVSTSIYAEDLARPLAKLGIRAVCKKERSPLICACIDADPQEVGALVQSGANINTTVEKKPLVVRLLQQCHTFGRPLGVRDHRALRALILDPALDLAGLKESLQSLDEVGANSSLSTYVDALNRRVKGSPIPVPGTVIPTESASTTVSFDGTALYRDGIRLPTPPQVDLARYRPVAYRNLIAFIPADPSLPIGKLSHDQGRGLLGGQGLITYSPRFDQWGRNLYWTFNAGNGEVSEKNGRVVVTDGGHSVDVMFPYAGDTFDF
ncbi:MAG: hypothetical protein H6729_01970 [Deltaproteobacteria bacterium]|nr:hypothetical protein [Deltaproteobacteria bacterium]